MRQRPGVTLTEVLVATVLLTVGIGGALGSLVASTRLRQRSATRDAVADAVDARLTWFAASACSASDSIHRTLPGAAVAEVWRVARDSAGAVLDGVASGPGGTRAVRLSLRARRSCP